MHDKKEIRKKSFPLHGSGPYRLNFLLNIKIVDRIVVFFLVRRPYSGSYNSLAPSLAVPNYPRYWGKKKNQHNSNRAPKMMDIRNWCGEARSEVYFDKVLQQYISVEHAKAHLSTAVDYSRMPS